MLPNNFSSTPIEAKSFDMGLRHHMQRIYNRMALGVLISAVISFFVGNSPQLLHAIYGTPLQFVVIFAPLAIVWFGFKPATMAASTLRLSFIALAVCYGLSLGYIFAVFTGESIAKTFFVAAGMFAGVSIIGYTTKKDLSGMGSFMIMGMWGLIALSLINMGLHFFAPGYNSTGLSNVIALVGIVVFAGMTAWETQRMKETYSAGDNDEMASRMAWVSALNLYISFIAMFQYLMYFMGNRR